ncbi:MAG: outer membrane protein transport protein [Deltaproteobacteria bacterium]|nr:outer membrane protein transport protein [Deltaproteobacteria bacterium]
MLLVLALLLQAPREARAGAFYLPERGARALSLGGAFIAGADDLNAQWLNPAALTRLSDGFNLYVDFGLIMSDQSFDRADDPEVMRKDPRYADGFPTAEDQGGPFPDPSLGIASNFGLEDWMFAFGFYGPYAGTNEWDPEGPQRYSLVSLQAVELFVQLSAAWQPVDELSIGVGLQWIVTTLNQRLVISAYPGVFGWAEQRDLEAFAQVSASDMFTLGANFGILWSPIDMLDIGVSAQLPASVEAEGELKVKKPEHYYFSDVQIEGDQLAVELDFPLILRLGIRLHDPEERWSVELAGVLEMWSAFDRIDVAPGGDGIYFRDVPGIGTYTVKPFAIEQRASDVISVRLGGSFRPGLGALTLRAGGYYESGATPDATLSVLDVDGDKLGLALGGTLHLGESVTVDFVGAWIETFERTVTTSTKTQVNPIYETDPRPFPDAGPSVIGNGTYHARNIIVALSLGVAL